MVISPSITIKRDCGLRGSEFLNVVISSATRSPRLVPNICLSTKRGLSMKETSFSFDRGRGIVWVCDIESSSKYLNDNESVQAIEQYLPRLHWLGRISVGSAGGHFIKWTGDGFLGWFPIEFHRDLGSRAERLVQAIWQLTLMNNVTRLGIEGRIPIRLKHGVTVEHDALITKSSNESGEHFDLIGRSVVLAFRLAGIKARFPGIVTQREVVEAIGSEHISKFKFAKLVLGAEERAKYFKGDGWGTNNLYASADRKPRARSNSAAVRSIRKIITEAEKSATVEDETDPTIQGFMKSLLTQLIREPTLLLVDFERAGAFVRRLYGAGI